MLGWESGKEELGHLTTHEVLCCDFYKCEFRLCNSRGNLKALIENSDFNIMNMNDKTKKKKFIFPSLSSGSQRNIYIPFTNPVHTPKFQIRDKLGSTSTCACWGILYNNVIGHKDEVVRVTGKVHMIKLLNSENHKCPNVFFQFLKHTVLLPHLKLFPLTRTSILHSHLSLTYMPS